MAAKPKLLFYQGYYYDIFQTLSGWREYTEQAHPKPLTLAQVMTYCEMFEIHSLEVRETLLHHMKILDLAYLTQEGKRVAAAAEEEKQKIDIKTKVVRS